MWEGPGSCPRTTAYMSGTHMHVHGAGWLKLGRDHSVKALFGVAVLLSLSVTNL